MFADLSDAFVALVTFQAKPTAYLVHLAMVAQAGGFLLRSQIHLRFVVLVGTGLYIAYYAFHPDTPLWDAIFASSVIGAANLVGLFAVTVDRIPFAMGRGRRLMHAFDTISPRTMQPGRVRLLARHAVASEMGETTTLLRKGLAPGALFLLLSGEARLAKGNTVRTVAAPCFLGEIAFVTGGVASANVDVLSGSRVVFWPAIELTRMMRASHELDRSLRALISYDLARKLAQSVPELPPEGDQSKCPAPLRAVAAPALAKAGAV